MELSFWIAIVIFIWFALNAGIILRYRFYTEKWPSKKVLIWINIAMILILTLHAILPKANGNCKVDIVINSKNSNSEIIINKNDIYYLSGDESMKLRDLERFGNIEIKTQNNEYYIFFYDNTHLFTYKHKIKINIKANKISVNSLSPLNIYSFDMNEIRKKDKRE
jgi:hypothetical protein